MLFWVDFLITFFVLVFPPGTSKICQFCQYSTLDFGIPKSWDYFQAWQKNYQPRMLGKIKFNRHPIRCTHLESVPGDPGQHDILLFVKY
jgi:hypothetical protein